MMTELVATQGFSVSRQTLSARQMPSNRDNRGTLLFFTALKKLREEKKWQFALF
ncbi:MAG: hypothetical protein QNK19_13395 [Xanthomonadales bacterium]|nr:hypothetical protein [Xanthomonadales bacterium]